MYKKETVVASMDGRRCERTCAWRRLGIEQWQARVPDYCDARHNWAWLQRFLGGGGGADGAGGPQTCCWSTQRKEEEKETVGVQVETRSPDLPSQTRDMREELDEKRAARGSNGPLSFSSEEVLEHVHPGLQSEALCGKGNEGWGEGQGQRWPRMQEDQCRE